MTRLASDWEAVGVGVEFGPFRPSPDQCLAQSATAEREARRYNQNRNTKDSDGHDARRSPLHAS